MLKAVNFSILMVLLFLSSCKKQVVKNCLENSRFHQNLEDNTGERAEAFSPVTDLKAKQFIGDLSSNDKDSFAFDVNSAIDSKVSSLKNLNLSDNNSKIKKIGSSEVIVAKDLSTQENQESVSQDFKNKIDDNELVRQKEAKLLDIPIPINSEPLMSYFKSKTSRNEIILGYNSFVDLNSVAKFYNQEMELFGWESVLFFNGIEKLMLFKKPSRFCSVSIRNVRGRLRSKKSSRDYKCEIVVFVQN